MDRTEKMRFCGGLRIVPPERVVILTAIFQRKGVQSRLMAVVPSSRRYHCLSITSKFFARLSSTNPNSPTCARLKATKVDSWIEYPHARVQAAPTANLATKTATTQVTRMRPCSNRKAGRMIKPMEDMNIAEKKCTMPLISLCTFFVWPLY